MSSAPQARFWGGRSLGGRSLPVCRRFPRFAASPCCLARRSALPGRRAFQTGVYIRNSFKSGLRFSLLCDGSRVHRFLPLALQCPDSPPQHSPPAAPFDVLAGGESAAAGPIDNRRRRRRGEAQARAPPTAPPSPPEATNCRSE